MERTRMLVVLLNKRCKLQILVILWGRLSLAAHMLNRIQTIPSTPTRLPQSDVHSFLEPTLGGNVKETIFGVVRMESLNM